MYHNYQRVYRSYGVCNDSYYGISTKRIVVKMTLIVEPSTYKWSLWGLKEREKGKGERGKKRVRKYKT